MTCFSCESKSLEESTTTYFAQLKNCIIIIKNVPCLKCSQCGEEYFRGTEIEHIEKIMSEAEKMTSELAIINYKDKIA